jgi:hypothetical protein
MRRLVLALVALAAIVVMPADAADRVVERGIVQSIDGDAVVLRALDGTRVTVALDARTRVRLNGRNAVVEDIRPGFVAVAVTAGEGPARALRAFGRAAPRRVRGDVVRVEARTLVVRPVAGTSVRIPLTSRTTAWRGDKRVRVATHRRGMRLDVRLAPSGAARTIVVLETVR